MKNIFDAQVTATMIDRLNELTPDTARKWGSMTPAQMLAHCNVTYEMVYTDKHKKPGAIMRFLLKAMVKKKVVNETPYPQNGPTAPQFKIKEDKDFEVEKKRLVDHLNKTQQLGAVHFENKESHSFGKLSSKEWNNMFYKHLNHHLQQFGA